MKRALVVIPLLLLLPRLAHADDADEAKQTASADGEPAKTEEQRKADDQKEEELRKGNLTPIPAEPPPSLKIRFTADPVGDGATLGLGVVFGLLSSAILSTDEIRPQQISPRFNGNQLLGIDSIAIRRSYDASARTISNIGLYTAIGYALVDTVADGFREGKSAALVDGIMYAEAFFLTQGVTNVAKIAFRRPRPIAYTERDNFIRAGGDPATYDNAAVDSSLSFVSGHASQTAAMAAAATYIAFSRSPGSPRGWLTLLGGTLLTSVVAVERVRAGAHFPTDVIGGAVVGTGVGALVVHMHREDSVRQRPVWIGGTPLPNGAMLSASGFF